MHRRARLALALLLCSGCVGVPRDPGVSPQAWRTPADAASEVPLPRLELVPIVPEMTRAPVPERPAPAVQMASRPGAAPFWTEVPLVNAGLMQVATTNNSLDPRVDPRGRGFPVCLRGDAVHYEVAWHPDLGEAVTTAEVAVAGKLGNCSLMSAPLHYLVLDREARSHGSLTGAFDPPVSYRVVASSTGFAPTTACAHPGLCPPLRVTLPALERALGGLRLAGQRPATPSQEAGVPLTVLTAAHRSIR